MNRIAYGMAAAALVLVGCHTITEELPTAPTQAPKAPTSGVLKVSIPSIPTVTPTPTPQATPPPSTSGCGNPLPPPIWKIGAKIHIKGPNRYTLDSTPQVHDSEYCAQIGFTDGRVDCPVRQEGAPDRFACEVYAIGRAGECRPAAPRGFLPSGAGRGRRMSTPRPPREN